MLLPELNVLHPANLNEAVGLLASLEMTGIDAMVYAGGTDVVPALKRRLYGAETLVSIGGLPEIRDIERIDDHTLRIGAGATLSAIARHATVAETAPWLATTVSCIASPQIRSRATLGGNILVDNRCRYFQQAEGHRDAHGACFKGGGDGCRLIPTATRDSTPVCRARFVSDGAAVLAVADARLNLVGASGARSVPLRTFYPDEGLERRRAGESEILTSIDVPCPSDLRVAYEKLRVRDAIDFPSLGVAMGVTGSKAAICLTGVSTYPVFAEAALADDREQTLSQLLTATRRHVVALAQDFFPPAYRREMVAVFARRLWSALTE